MLFFVFLIISPNRGFLPLSRGRKTLLINASFSCLFAPDHAKRVVVKSPIPPPLGFKRVFSPAETKVGLSKRLNSQVAVTNRGSLS